MNRLILANAEKLRQLHARIHEIFKVKPHGPEHHAACTAFRAAYDALAFPGGLEAQLERLRQHDPTAIELATQFLGADPKFNRSGYIKETMLRRLKRCELNERQKELLRQLIIRSVESGGRREHHGYARLAGSLHTPDLIQAMQVRVTSSKPEVSRRATEVLNVIRSNTKQNKLHPHR